MIELRNLTKRYGHTLAVDHLNLSVEKGEIFGFIGPNGAGKTTTIRMMAGVLGPTEGTVLIDGIPMATDPEAAKRIIGFIPGPTLPLREADRHGIHAVYRRSLRDWGMGTSGRRPRGC